MFRPLAAECRRWSSPPGRLVLIASSGQSLMIGDVPEASGQPAGFWSYVRADDEADGGRITRLAARVQSEFQLLTGESIAVFVDREAIGWGDEWQRRIDEALEGTAFFVLVITPRYFQSEACRAELLTFSGHAESLRPTGESFLPGSQEIPANGKIMRLAGIEPATSRSGGARSIP